MDSCHQLNRAHMETVIDVLSPKPHQKYTDLDVTLPYGEDESCYVTHGDKEEEVIYKIDNGNKVDNFAAVDYRKISMTISPEEACSSISMTVRMTKVETMLSILRKDMEEQTENVGTLFDVMYKKPSYANKVAVITGPKQTGDNRRRNGGDKVNPSGNNQSGSGGKQSIPVTTNERTQESADIALTNEHHHGARQSGAGS